MSVLEKISKKWVKVGQKITRMHVLCEIKLLKGYTSTEIAPEVRIYKFRRTPFGDKRRAADKVYVSIMKEIRLYYKYWTSGK